MRQLPGYLGKLSSWPVVLVRRAAAVSWRAGLRFLRTVAAGPLVGAFELLALAYTALWLLRVLRQLLRQAPGASLAPEAAAALPPVLDALWQVRRAPCAVRRAP